MENALRKEVLATLYTSDINLENRRCLNTSLTYLIISIFCAFFGAVYEVFSHEVYSYFMLYAFAFPLVGGTFPFLIMALVKSKKPQAVSRNLYHSGIATLTLGSIVNGVLEIYGTTNSLMQFYWLVGTAFVATGIIAYLLSIVLRKDIDKT